MKEVTILLAVKNGEKWLEKTLISVRNQTFKEYEFLIIDDGSTDLTKTIILKHKELDARIKYFYKKHSGLTESLNYGLGKASGKWIARLDADDLALPDRLNKQLSFVKNKKNTVLVGSNFFLQKNKITIYSSNLPNSNSKLIYRLKTLKGFFPHSSAFFAREVAIQVGGYRASFIKSQDHDLWLRLSERGEINCLSEKLVIINEHSGRISNSHSDYSQQVYASAAIYSHYCRLKEGTDKKIFKDSGFRLFLKLLDSYLAKNSFFKFLQLKEDIKSIFSQKQKGLFIIRLIYKILTNWNLFYKLVVFYFFGSKLPLKFYKTKFFEKKF